MPSQTSNRRQAQNPILGKIPVVIEAGNLEQTHRDSAAFEFAARWIPVAFEQGDFGRVHTLGRAHYLIKLREINGGAEAEAQWEEESGRAVGKGAVGKHALHLRQHIAAEM